MKPERVVKVYVPVHRAVTWPVQRIEKLSTPMAAMLLGASEY